MHAHHEGYKYGHGQLILREQQLQSVGAARRRKGKGEGGGKGRRKGGKERRKERRKEKRKGEEKRKKKRKRKRKECCAMSRPGRQRTRNYATRGRFPPTLVILRLGAV